MAAIDRFYQERRAAAGIDSESVRHPFFSALRPLVFDARERLLRGNSQLAPEAARLLAEGGIGPDPSRPGALAWKWDPLLRARSPLPITQEVLQQIVSLVRAPVLLLRAERGHLPEEDELRRRFSHLTALTIETVGGTSHHLHLEEPRLVADRIARAWKEAGG